MEAYCFVTLSRPKTALRGLLIGAAVLFLSLPAAATWSIITINASSPIDEGMHPSAAIDSSGYLRIAFLRTSTYDLMYYYRTWAGGLIETAVSTGNVGQFCSMALDSRSRPSIADRLARVAKEDASEQVRAEAAETVKRLSF